MPFFGRHQIPRFDFAKDISQVQVAVGNVFDFVTTNFAQITQFAFRNSNFA